MKFEILFFFSPHFWDYICQNISDFIKEKAVPAFLEEHIDN